MNEDNIRKITREEIKDAISKAYGRGHLEGFYDACDMLSAMLSEAIATLKESAKEVKVDVYDEKED